MKNYLARPQQMYYKSFFLDVLSNINLLLTINSNSSTKSRFDTISQKIHDICVHTQSIYRRHGDGYLWVICANIAQYYWDVTIMKKICWSDNTYWEHGLCIYIYCVVTIKWAIYILRMLSIPQASSHQKYSGTKKLTGTKRIGMILWRRLWIGIASVETHFSLIRNYKGVNLWNWTVWRNIMINIRRSLSNLYLNRMFLLLILCSCSNQRQKLDIEQ